MKYWIFIICYFAFTSISLSKNFSKTQLEEVIESNNEKLEFEASIKLLHKIVLNPESSNYEKYTAYYLKYKIYKRLYNYTEALFNLNLAQKYRDKTDLGHKYQFELMLVDAERLNYKKVREQAAFLAKYKQEKLTRQDYALVLFLEAVILFEESEENSAKSLSLLDTCTVILEESNSEYLPVVFRVKMHLNGLLKKEDQVIKNYNLGVAYANKYNRVGYLIDLHRTMSVYYKNIGNNKQSIMLSELILKSVSEFNYAKKSSQLKNIELELTKNHNQQLGENQKQEVALLIVLTSFGIITIIVLILFFKRKRKNLILLKTQNNVLRLDVENLLNKETTINTNKSVYQLTDRQLEIIALVRKGMTNKQIAIELFISENTVKYHLKIIYEQLGVKSRKELI